MRKQPANCLARDSIQYPMHFEIKSKKAIKAVQDLDSQTKELGLCCQEAGRKLFPTLQNKASQPPPSSLLNCL